MGDVGTVCGYGFDGCWYVRHRKWRDWFGPIPEGVDVPLPRLRASSPLVPQPVARQLPPQPVAKQGNPPSVSQPVLQPVAKPGVKPTPGKDPKSVPFHDAVIGNFRERTSKKKHVREEHFRENQPPKIGTGECANKFTACAFGYVRKTLKLARLPSRRCIGACKKNPRAVGCGPRKLGRRRLQQRLQTSGEAASGAMVNVFGYSQWRPRGKSPQRALA